MHINKYVYKVDILIERAMIDALRLLLCWITAAAVAGSSIS